MIIRIIGSYTNVRLPVTPLLQDYSQHYDKDISSVNDINRQVGNATSAKMGLLKEVDEPSKKAIIFDYNLWPTFEWKNAVLVDNIIFHDQVSQETIKKEYSYSVRGLLIVKIKI